MKKLLALLLILMLACSAACAESPWEYAAWLEEVLPGAAFADAQIPNFILEKLGADYDFIARSDAEYGSYIAGVRKDSAPDLPDDAHASAGGTFSTATFRVQDDAGKIYYDFILADGVQIQAYDNLQHLVIHVDETPGEYAPFEPLRSIIFQSASVQGHAQLTYAAENGFSPERSDQTQLSIALHSRETWQMGATREPHCFYLDAALPQDLLGERFLEEDELIAFTRIPIGLQFRDGENHYELVVSQTGVKGIETSDPHRLYEAGPGFDALVNQAEKALGYRPGNVDFLGKEIRSATLEWEGGQVGVALKAPLRRLEEMLAHADFSVGSVNCPSPCFLTLEFGDGSSAALAVAINSFDLFFYNGMYFTAGDGELLEIFNLKAEDIYVYE